MKKNAMYYVTIILTILFILVNTYSYAAEITKESLTKFFEEYVEEETNNGELSGSIVVTDNEIIIKTEETEDRINYDLTGKPKFSVEMRFEEEMTYDECNKETSKVTNILIGFMAVAGINGVDPSDALAYGLFSYMGKTFEQSNGETEITEKNFVDALDYAQKSYSKDMIIEDDLFTMTIKKAELKDEEYIVNTDLVVNTEKDFSVLYDETNEIGNTIANSIVGGLSNSIGSISNEIIANTNNTVNLTPSQPTKTPSIANIEKMPNAGFELNTLNILKIALGLSIVGVIVYSIYNKRYNSK